MEFCEGRPRYTEAEARHYVADVSGMTTLGRVRYVVGGRCEACGGWHLRVVERDLGSDDAAAAAG
jgi:hypothetical protein